MRRPDSEASRLLHHLGIWLIAIAVELVLRKVIDAFGGELGFAADFVERAHIFMSVLFCVTLISTALCATGEVISLGLRRLLRELTHLIGDFRNLQAAYSKKRGKE